MLKDFLKLTWNEVMDSDYYYKSNTAKHVIQIAGSEIGDDYIPVILIYYNYYTGRPMVVTLRCKPEHESLLPEIEGFNRTKETNDFDEDGENDLQVVYVENSTFNALE